MLTLNEICDRMNVQYNAEEVCELLEITTEELLDHFEWKVSEHYDKLNEELSDEHN